MHNRHIATLALLAGLLVAPAYAGALMQVS